MLKITDFVFKHLVAKVNKPATNGVVHLELLPWETAVERTVLFIKTIRNYKTVQEFIANPIVKEMIERITPANNIEMDVQAELERAMIFFQELPDTNLVDLVFRHYLNNLEAFVTEHQDLYPKPNGFRVMLNLDWEGDKQTGLAMASTFPEPLLHEKNWLTEAYRFLVRNFQVFTVGLAAQVKRLVPSERQSRVNLKQFRKLKEKLNRVAAKMDEREADSVDYSYVKIVQNMIEVYENQCVLPHALVSRRYQERSLEAAAMREKEANE